MGKGTKLAAVLAVLACLGCGDNDRAALDYDLSGAWEAVDAACTSNLTPADLGLPADLPEALPELRLLLDPAYWAYQIEGPVRLVQTGDRLEIFDVEALELTEVFAGTVTGNSLAYALSQDGVYIEGQGDIVSPSRLEIDHTITLEESGATVSCQFDAVRL